MTRFLGALVLIVAVVVVVGLYMDWFHIRSDTTEGQTHVTFTVDQEKIMASGEKAVDEGKKIIKEVRGTVNRNTESTAPAPESQNPK